MSKIKKNTWMIAEWSRSSGGETDVALFKNQFKNAYGYDCFTWEKFFRIRGKNISDLRHDSCNDRTVPFIDNRYSLNWRPMTQKEIVKYLSLILQSDASN